jgi:MoxR-like ATPase
MESLIGDPEVRGALERIVAHEEEKENRYRTDPVFRGMPSTPWWEWSEIPVDWQVVRRLLLAGVVKAQGGRRKWYVLSDRAAVSKALAEYGELQRMREEKVVAVAEEGVPGDLFDVIVGYADLKEFFRMTLKAEEPVHCLMVGAPGTAKSLFLMELERLGGRFITAGTATKVGIRDIIFEELPRILIIDELDKISDAKDLSALLTWMESGRIVIAKHGLAGEKRGRGWVFAAANTTRGLPAELLDRFQVFHIKPYTPDEFFRVVTGYLTARLGVPDALARHITRRVVEYSVSVREAVRIARLAKTEGEVDRIVEIVRRYAG